MTRWTIFAQAVETERGIRAPDQSLRVSVSWYTMAVSFLFFFAGLNELPLLSGHVMA